MEIKSDIEKASKKLIIKEAAVPFISRGGKIFPNQVEDFDPEIRDGEILEVVDTKGRILAIAQAFFKQEELAKMRLTT